MDSFVALDFETATRKRYSACSLAIVTVNQGRIIETYHTYIRPPENEYEYRNIDVHGITPELTEYCLDFRDCYNDIFKRLKGKKIVAHNESFDRSVLKRTLEFYDIQTQLSLDSPWECTYKLWKKAGMTPTTLKHCCDHFDIPLKHHDAISDAEAAAKLYIIYQYYQSQKNKK